MTNRKSGKVKRSGTTRSFTNQPRLLGKTGATSRGLTRSGASGTFISPGETIDIVIDTGEDARVTRRGSYEIVTPRVGRGVVSPSGTAKGQPGPPERRSSITAEDQVQAEAARLRQITDRKLGKTTPAWVSRLAGRRS